MAKKLDLTKIANEPVGWILHGTIYDKPKLDPRNRTFQLTAGELINYLSKDFNSYKEVYDYLEYLIKQKDKYHQKGSRDPNFILEKFVNCLAEQVVYLRCRELLAKNYDVTGGKH